MKHWKVYLKFLIILGLLANTTIACSGNRAGLKSPDRRYLKTSKDLRKVDPRSNEQSLKLFRSIIISHIKNNIGNRGAENSPAIVAGLVTGKGDVVVGLGSREIYKNLPPDGDTLFGICSVSKVFTGLMLAKAVTNGDISLSDKANKWLEDTIQINDGITLKHLISHFSGLPNFPENINKRVNDSEDPEISKLMPCKNYSKTDLENSLKNKNSRPLKLPRDRYLYSNLGIGILSIALENRYGFNDFNSMNQALITNVLNMDNTSTNIPSFLEKHKTNLAQGYAASIKGLQAVPFSDMGILAGSGELISNANDMNKLLKSLTGLLPGSLDAAVKESKRKLAKIQKMKSIGYALDIRPASDGGNIYYKTGSCAGFTAIMLWRDKPKIGLIMLANRGKFRLLPISKRLLEAITHQLKVMQNNLSERKHMKENDIPAQQIGRGIERRPVRPYANQSF
ncbi:MAG: beta-lactamase family protein [Planctomycetes bacterium]|nr:beta-lactamase family protein [Planctomycetota bacterium]